MMKALVNNKIVKPTCFPLRDHPHKYARQRHHSHAIHLGVDSAQKPNLCYIINVFILLSFYTLEGFDGAY
jgi:hypothetical protein